MCDSAFSQRRHQKAGAGSIRRRINIARCQPANLHHSSPLRCKGPGGTTKFPQRWKLNQICWSSKLMWEPGLLRGVRYTGPYLCCNSKGLAIVNQIRSRFPWLQGQEKTSPPPSWSKDHLWAASHYVDTRGLHDAKLDVRLGEKCDGYIVQPRRRVVAYLLFKLSTPPPCSYSVICVYQCILCILYPIYISSTYPGQYVGWSVGW